MCDIDYGLYFCILSLFACHNVNTLFTQRQNKTKHKKKSLHLRIICIQKCLYIYKYFFNIFYHMWLKLCKHKDLCITRTVALLSYNTQHYIEIDPKRKRRIKEVTALEIIKWLHFGSASLENCFKYFIW